METVFVERERGEIVVARGVELVRGEGRTRRKDARELASDEFARLRRFGLIANRDFLSGGEELGNVIVDRVSRQPQQA